MAPSMMARSTMFKCKSLVLHYTRPTHSAGNWNEDVHYLFRFEFFSIWNAEFPLVLRHYIRRKW